MRGLLGLVLVVVLGLFLASYFGFINFNTSGGRLPQVEARAGSLPNIDVDTAKVEVVTTNTNVAVPTIKTEEKRVEVPKLRVERPANEQR